MRVATQTMIIDPSGSELFAGSTAGLYKSLDSDDAYLHIKCFKDGVWHVLASSGTISNE